MGEPRRDLSGLAAGTSEVVDRALAGYRPRPAVREVGTVLSVGSGVARVRGLPNVQAEELVRFGEGRLGMAFNLDRDDTARSRAQVQHRGGRLARTQEINRPLDEQLRLRPGNEAGLVDLDG